MASYLITGASRGIGFEFVRQLSADPSNTVIGLVRDKVATDKKVQEELGRSNIHVLTADLADYQSLKQSVHGVSKIVNGSLDYLIANGAFVPSWSQTKKFGDLGESPEKLEEDMLDSFKTNVIGNVHLFNLCVPLVRNGRAKKVIAISSGMADNDLIKNYGIDFAGPYAVSKAALNTVVAKFSAQYADEGILFMSMCPGVVQTDNNSVENASEEMKNIIATLTEKLTRYAPDFSGPATKEASVKDVMSVVYQATVETGYGGCFVSHLGKGKPWL
ncbi:NAD(P)-binding protein [Biscogniauxia marginata]|nr:NAD(P)-binding protein [Biscogniauxia marginata]